MIDTIYVEHDVAHHQRFSALRERYPNAAIVPCRRYGEVFNPGGQNFRLQKANPALIVARKHANHVLPAPAGYGIGGQHNYYFSHMLNCLYDCRYCFLQGMFRSANYVWFVNYEAFADAIDETLQVHADEPVWFYSGYDCDSLALDPLSGFSQWALQTFAERPLAKLELRTKSTQIRALLAHPPLPNVVVAFSFTPERAWRALEHKVPGVERRAAAMRRLADAGWQVGLRFDPLLYSPDFERDYARLFEQTLAAVDRAQVHSVSLGSFRLPKPFHKTMTSLYPREPLFAQALTSRGRHLAYAESLEKRLFDFCRSQLNEYIDPARLFTCDPPSGPDRIESAA